MKIGTSASRIGNLRSILRNRLKVYKSKKYLKWFGSNKVQIGHIHHILESVYGLKLNDYLLVDMSAEEHNRIHYAYQSEDDFLNDFIQSLNSLMEYVAYLETRK